MGASHSRRGPLFEAWNKQPLAAPWPGFELCSECDGEKFCTEGEHPYCRGWCHVCGGAGQWSLDAAVDWYSPSAPMVNLEHLRKQRQRP